MVPVNYINQTITLSILCIIYCGRGYALEFIYEIMWLNHKLSAFNIICGVLLFSDRQVHI